MQYKQGNNRYQAYFGKLEDQVSPANTVRLTDAFTDTILLNTAAASVIYLNRIRRFSGAVRSAIRAATKYVKASGKYVNA